MLKSIRSLNQSLVLSLRISLALIVAAVVFIGIQSSAQFRLIAEKKAVLTNGAIPTLSEAQKLVALLATQAEQIRSLQRYAGGSDIGSLQTEILQRQNEVTLHLERLEGLDLVEGLSADIALMFDNTYQLISLQQSRQSLEAMRVEKSRELRRLIVRGVNRIEGQRLEGLTELQSLFTEVSSDHTAAVAISRQTTQLQRWVEMGLRLQTILSVLALDPDEMFQPEHKLVQDMLPHLGKAVLLLTHMPPGEGDRQLAEILSEIRSAISGADGLSSNAESLQDVNVQILDLTDISTLHINEITGRIGRASAIAERNAGQVSSELDASIGQVAALNLLTILVFGAGAIGITIYFIELRLNRRIKKLMIAVRELSQGNVRHQIDVTGVDELGKIAQALRVAQTAASDLERSNADLESFAYAASHDLKTPIRAITDLATWTLEDFSEELPDDAAGNLTLLKDRSIRLSRLLDGLLLYAKVDGLTSPNEVVDLNEECRSIMDFLDPHQNFQINVKAPADGFSTALVPLQQILNNLLSNAVKHHDKSGGKLNVQAWCTDQNVTVSVEDDGPGIPQKYHARIFELFQKLESQDTTEGAGIGLALVKKLADRHGQGVAVDSLSGRGTRFTVTLSIKEAEHREALHKAA